MILENLKHSYFRFNTHIYFPESGSRKLFHASGMRAINFSPRNYPKKSVFRRKSEKIFALKRSSTLIFRVKLNFSRLKMRAIDFLPRNYLKKSVFTRKSEKKFSKKFTFANRLITVPWCT